VLDLTDRTKQLHQQLKNQTLVVNLLLTLIFSVFFRPYKLKWLYLDNNDLPALPEDTFANLKLYTLALNGNPGLYQYDSKVQKYSNRF
jgi:hypothetical protein